MADTPATNGAQNGGAPNGGGAAGAASAPSLNALAQYTKDFSFENPTAPRSLAPQQAQPKIGIQQARPKLEKSPPPSLVGLHKYDIGPNG